jgi:hypothetical protein
MATMTPSTFDPLLRYVNVRLQQGVPIVDADENEREDIRKFELRAFLKWYVGDGIPAGSDGFRIAGGLDNDFTIEAGVPPPPSGAAPLDVALRHAGRLIVDGLDVLITANVRYTAQPLHSGQPGAAALATRLGVPVVGALTTPGSNQTLLAYLDVWERLVTGEEVPDLVHPGLGVETCARIRREWVVRVRPGGQLPVPTDSDYVAGHTYHPLAVLNRRGGAATIAVTDIADRRGRGLLMPPAHLLADTVGTGTMDDAAYRRGEGRPAVSLREAINSLLAGRLPSTADLPVAPGTGNDVLRRAAMLDAGGGLVVVWHSPRVNSTNQVYAARLDPAGTGGFSSPVAVTAGSTATIEPTAVALPSGELIVAYPTVVSGTTNVDMKRASLNNLPTVSPQQVAATPNVNDQTPHAVLAGDRVVFFSHLASNNQWHYRRYDHVTPAFVDTDVVALPTVVVTTRSLHAAAAGGMVWVAYSDGTNTRLLRLNATTGVVDASTTVTGTSTSGDPFVVAISATDAVVFYHDGTVLRSVTATGAAWGSAVAVPGTDASDSQPAAIRDPDGNLYLFYTRQITGTDHEIVLRRRGAVTTEWTAPQQLIGNPASDQRPHPVLVPGRGIWLVYASSRTGNLDLYARQLLTSI